MATAVTPDAFVLASKGCYYWSNGTTACWITLKRNTLTSWRWRIDHGGQQVAAPRVRTKEQTMKQAAYLLNQLVMQNKAWDAVDRREVS